MKLHLGCGQRYLEGYLNIDYPLGEHTVQAKSVADHHINILDLNFVNGSVEEVRLHHVFEHFDRPTAFALLLKWRNWLKDDGVLHIEVPDFFWSSIIATLLPSRRLRLVGVRHLFGSHEASWAIHCEGWSKGHLKYVLEQLGYEIYWSRRAFWRWTVNLEIKARKSSRNLEDVESQLGNIFKNYLLDESSSELSLKKIWVRKSLDLYQKDLV